MELKAFINVFIAQKRLFLALFCLPTFLVVLYSIFFLEKKIDGHLTLTIVRTETEEKKEKLTIDERESEDRYDSYYRLSANETYTEDIVQMLSAPRVVEEIIAEATGKETTHYTLKHLKNFFQAQKESPHIIEVRYRVTSEDFAKKIPQALTRKINDISTNLDLLKNKGQAFQIISQEPVIRIHRYNYEIMIISALLIGLSLAILGTLFRFYYSQEEN